MTKNILYICRRHCWHIPANKGILPSLQRPTDSISHFRTRRSSPGLQQNRRRWNHNSRFSFKETGERDTTDISRIFTETLHGQTLSVCSLPLPETHPINPEYHLKAETVNDSTEMADIVLPEVCILAPMPVKRHRCCLYQQPPEVENLLLPSWFLTRKNHRQFRQNPWMGQIPKLGSEPLSQTSLGGWEYGEYSRKEKLPHGKGVAHLPTNIFSWIPGSNWALWRRRTDLINALNAYNAEHPDAPKDSTFPGM